MIAMTWYGITLWGADCRRLEKLQKQCIRKINQVKRHNGHTDRLFKQSELLKISDIHKLFSLKFYYRYTRRELENYFLNDIFPRNSSFHRYATSRSNEYHVLTHHSPQVKPTIRYQIPVLLPSIPTDILAKIETHSLQSFSRHVKLFFLGCYSESCPIGPPDCYVCSEKTPHVPAEILEPPRVGYDK